MRWVLSSHLSRLRNISAMARVIPCGCFRETRQPSGCAHAMRSWGSAEARWPVSQATATRAYIPRNEAEFLSKARLKHLSEARFRFSQAATPGSYCPPRRIPHAQSCPAHAPLSSGDFLSQTVSRYTSEYGHNLRGAAPRRPRSPSRGARPQTILRPAIYARRASAKRFDAGTD